MTTTTTTMKWSPNYSHDLDSVDYRTWGVIQERVCQTQ